MREAELDREIAELRRRIERDKPPLQEVGAKIQRALEPVYGRGWHDQGTLAVSGPTPGGRAPDQTIFQRLGESGLRTGGLFTSGLTTSGLTGGPHSFIGRRGDADRDRQERQSETAAKQIELLEAQVEQLQQSNAIQRELLDSWQ